MDSLYLFALFIGNRERTRSREKMKRIKGSWMLAGALVFVVSACGGQDETKSSTQALDQKKLELAKQAPQLVQDLQLANPA